MTNSPRAGSFAAGPLAVRDGAGWAESNAGAVTSAPSAVAPLSIVRRLKRVRVIVILPVVVGSRIMRRRAV
jgi:hypothetical protein